LDIIDYLRHEAMTAVGDQQLTTRAAFVDFENG